MSLFAQTNPKTLTVFCTLIINFTHFDFQNSFSNSIGSCDTNILLKNFHFLHRTYGSFTQNLHSAVMKLRKA